MQPFATIYFKREQGHIFICHLLSLKLLSLRVQ